MGGNTVIDLAFLIEEQFEIRKRKGISIGDVSCCEIRYEPKGYRPFLTLRKGELWAQGKLFESEHEALIAGNELELFYLIIFPEVNT